MLPLSSLQHTLTLTPNWHGARRSAQRSRLPTNYHTASTTLPPVSTAPPTDVPLTPELFASFFHYVVLVWQSAFLTFNYAECQSSSRLTSSTLDCLTPPTNRCSPNNSLPFSGSFSIIAPVSFLTLNYDFIFLASRLSL